MAQTYTLEELRTRVYERGGWLMETSRHTPATLTRELSLSAMDLRDQMLRAGLTHLFVTSEDIPTVSGTTTYAVTDGYYQVVGVSVETQTNHFVPLRSFSEMDRPHLLDTNVARAGYPLFYQVTGAGSIEVLPTPTGVYTMTVRYIPPSPPLVSDDDTFDGLNGLEEWMVCDVVRKLAATERDWPTVQAMDAMCARLGERITTMSRMRDRAGPRRVVDVRTKRRRYV